MCAKLSDILANDVQAQLHNLVTPASKKRKRKRPRKKKEVPAVTVSLKEKTYTKSEIESLMGANRYIPGRKSLLK